MSQSNKDDGIKEERRRICKKIFPAIDARSSIIEEWPNQFAGFHNIVQVGRTTGHILLKIGDKMISIHPQNLIELAKEYDSEEKL